MPVETFFCQFTYDTLIQDTKEQHPRGRILMKQKLLTKK